ncbi:peptidase domain-containing ABC transporter [Clostridium sp. MSJ-8]|uniref:peptidase domain-containing ABC transporter n=1 Tax=Clostridium sp. MSJ-8 TaxID=2841510 RepID=UPI001C0F167E|nr:peptidase domain-containing ABC transporter [Clostridium sp. MSJ-8]MBU5488947.1 peptidase domain-containing ABC transporter [Clostridium sp. MSJ-8]
MKLSKKYPYVKQMDDNDCGPACLATVLKYYKYKISITRLREICKTDINGTTMLGLIKAAQKLGFSAKGVNGKGIKALKSNFPKPAIAHVIYGDGVRHYVVLYEVTDSKVIVADTGRGIITYSIEEFLKIWSGKLIFLIPPSEFKENEYKNPYIRFVKLISMQKKLIISIFFASLFIAILGILGSFYYKILIDNVIPNNLYNKLKFVSITMICIVSLKTIIELLRNILLLFISKNIDVQLLLGYYSHILKLPMEFFESRDVGSIISRFNDGVKIRDAISSTAVTVFLDTLMAVVGGIILYRLSGIMFFVCFIPIVIYLFLVVKFKSKIEESNRDVMENNSKVTSYLVESIEGVEVIKSYNSEEYNVRKFKKRFNYYMESLFKNGFILNILESLKGITKVVFGICILWLGAYLTLKGQVTVGTFISFNALLAYFIEPIERVINLQSQIQSAMVAADRLGQILDLQIESYKNDRKSLSLAGDIIFENITFRYGFRRIILQDFNLHIKNKERIALVGESGSGKTTIVKILMKFYEIEKGKITINSNDLVDISPRQLRNRIAYISQESYFFSGTIRENLLIGNNDASEEDMVNICKKVFIHDYIMSLPKKYDNVLSEKAMNLSGGQRQRLAIARALLKKPDILIMDEATSNLDSITEKALEKTINECTNGITTIIIAHRLSTIKNCDRIFVIEDGQIIEEGSHEELLNNKGEYCYMWNKQFS